MECCTPHVMHVLQMSPEEKHEACQRADDSVQKKRHTGNTLHFTSLHSMESIFSSQHWKLENTIMPCIPTRRSRIKRGALGSISCQRHDGKQSCTVAILNSHFPLSELQSCVTGHLGSQGDSKVKRHLLENRGSGAYLALVLGHIDCQYG